MKNRPLLILLASLCAALMLMVLAVFLLASRRGVQVSLGANPELAAPSADGRGGGAPLSEPANASTYGNEQLPEMLQRQSADMGIESFATRGEREATSSEGFLGPRLGTPESRTHAEAAIRQLATLRRGIESHKKPSVPITGETARLLAEPGRGGEAIEKEAPGPTAGPQAPPQAARDRAITRGSAASEVLGAADSWSGPYGAGVPGAFTVSDAKAWSELWRNISSQEPPPAVDFTRSRVVAVFLGHRATGGYHVELSPAAETVPTSVIVRYREIEPSPGRTPPEGATSPYAMRVIPKSDLPVRFERTP